VLIKAVTYAATFVLAGGVIFLHFCHDLISESNQFQIRIRLRVSLVLGLFASTVRVFVLAGSMGDSIAAMWDASLVQMIARTGEGTATGFRLLGFLLTASALFSRRRPGYAALIGAMLAATSFAWVGHAKASAPNLLPTLLLSVHLLGVAFWLGALVPLYSITRNANLENVAAVATRFGRIAPFLVAALITAGAIVLWILVAGESEIRVSGYARAFLVKLGLVVLLLGFAALNKMDLSPRLRSGASKAVGRLRQSIVAEIALALLVLVVTATLTTLLGPSTGAD